MLMKKSHLLSFTNSLPLVVIIFEFSLVQYLLTISWPGVVPQN